MKYSLDYIWLGTLMKILKDGRFVSPRGMKTQEIPQHTVEVDMRRPVLTLPSRELSYRFMAAEAYWILTGDNKVSGIKPYCKNIAKFSDDGEIFNGAYGPRIMAQLNYVVEKLITDPDTRQAGLTIWKENPPNSKDIPCTIAIWCQIREGRLYIHVFMRSSDAWLGLPYDVFNFSMFGHLICGILNTDSRVETSIEPGRLFLTAASSHLYSHNWDAAGTCLGVGVDELASIVPLTPPQLFCGPECLMEWLDKLRTAPRGSDLRWWEEKTNEY